MPKVAHVADLISHGGSITTGRTNRVNDGRPIACVGDTANCSTHGTVTILTGSSKFFIDGKAVARVGDVCSCGAIITTGSDTLISD